MTSVTISYDFTLSRYHAAAWSVVGIAAGYGIYTIWATNLSRPVTNLHRRGAVHRTRRQAVESMEILNPTPDAPLGQIILHEGEESYTIRLGLDDFPTQSHLNIGTDRYHEIQGMAVEMTLQACFSAIHDATLWAQFNNELRLGDFLRALSDRDEALLLGLTPHLASRLGMSDTAMSIARVQAATSVFLVSPSWAAFEAASPVDSTADDPAETEEDPDALSNSRREPGQGLRSLLYYVAEDNVKRKAYEHRGIICEECGEQYIRGVRWHCLNCPNYDLCSACERTTVHPRTHVFAKIKIPLPVLSQPTKPYTLWYPGDPRKVHGSLDPNLKKRLCQESEFDEHQLDALYDQFTCLTNVPYPQGDEFPSSGVKAAIDRRAFNKALTSERWTNRFAPNAIYDRMFAFYDTDRKGFIGFEDFVSGLAYLRGPRRFASLDRAARGFDLDDDGYVDRKDMLRLLEAKFAINQQLVRDVVESQELEQTHKGMDTLRSSQPISSIFAEETVPPGENRPVHGKAPDAYGDMQPLHGAKTILDDDDPWQKSAPRPHEQLRGHFSRFDELISPSPEVDGTAESSSDAALRAPQVINVNTLHDDTEEPHIADALWQVTQEGLNELLNRLFDIRDDEDRVVEETKAGRTKWRAEIDRLLEASLDKSGPTTLKLDDSSSNRPTSASTPIFTDEIIPTDNDALARRERALSSRSVEELLSDSGYSIQDDTEPPTRSAKPSHLRNEILQEEYEYLTPNGTGDNTPPSAQLLYWGNVVDMHERAIQERGGPGRLSYAEIETIVVDDDSGELRGLVKSWLEWAAF